MNQIDKSVVIYNGSKLVIGDNVRIDAGVILSCGAGITIGNNVHIAAYSMLSGNGAPIVIEDFAGISARCNLFTATDDYSAGYMTGPTVADKYKRVRSGPITLEKHVIIGCGSVILPGVTLAFGTSVGALSLVNKSTNRCDVVSGNPAKYLKSRSYERLIDMERRFQDEKALDNYHD